jgi:type I restriction-modification system DNA methylase subunit
VISSGRLSAYRDSETLNLFLKEMDGFRYDHSEDLGDAYEYLLSILGTQGKAGQFRTPRHIIDFIVRCVDPPRQKRNRSSTQPAAPLASSFPPSSTSRKSTKSTRSARTRESA